MEILFIVAIIIVILGVVNYDKVSYKKQYERYKINSKHPNWTPYCGVNFLKKDPQWFINNGYKDYIEY